MTLDEFSKRCAEMADELHKLQEESEDDETDLEGVMVAILAAHLRYVVGGKLLTLLNA